MPRRRRAAANRRSNLAVDLPFGLLLAFLALCVVGGGSSRPDVLSLLYLRPAAIAALAFFCWRCTDWPQIRSLAILLAALALIYLVQVLPLPPVLYDMLPGRTSIDEIQLLNGTDSRWRSLSLDPDATLNALFSLAVPAAMLAGLGAIRVHDRDRLLVVVIALILSGAILGVLQVTGGHNSPFYLYENTYPGYAVGWFANRNHQAAALACLFPLLRVWASRDGDVIKGQARTWMAVAAAIIVLPMIFATGSRAGLILGFLSLLMSAIIMPPRFGVTSRNTGIALAVGLVAIIGFASAMLMMDRAASFDRLFQSGDLGSEGRIAYLPTEWRILAAFWPWGIGAGAFDPAIRMFEPDTLLHTTYFNHAHNDFLEMVLVAGLPAIILMTAAMATLTYWTVRAFRPYRQSTGSHVLARAGAIVLWILVGASTVDYPLRSPLMAVIAVIAAVWLIRTGQASDIRRQLR